MFGELILEHSSLYERGVPMGECVKIFILLGSSIFWEDKKR